MEKIKKEKSFDAVKMMRDTRDKIRLLWKSIQQSASSLSKTPKSINAKIKKKSLRKHSTFLATF